MSDTVMANTIVDEIVMAMVNTIIDDTAMADTVMADTVMADTVMADMIVADTVAAVNSISDIAEAGTPVSETTTQTESTTSDTDATSDLSSAPVTDDSQLSDGNPASPSESSSNKRPHDNTQDANEEPIKHAKTDSKPAYDGPEVWAERRQSLCEALPYFHSYNGSLYTQNLEAKGFYMDKQARAQDIFQAQVIITSVGGGRVRDEDTGKMTRVTDMAEDNRAYKAFVKARDDRALLPIIVGHQHPYWPTTPEHAYSVLDWFKVTDVWSELNVMEPKKSRSGAAQSEPMIVRVFCVRLEKADLSKPSWWDHAPESYIKAGPSPSSVCGYCNVSSKQILSSGWTCLNHDCETGFFRDALGQKITSFSYSRDFLHERTDFIGPMPTLKPEVTTKQLNGIDLTGSESIFRAGIVCQKCGCCTSRRYWNRWQCENCGDQITTKMVAYPKALVKAEVRMFLKTVERARKLRHVTDNLLATRLDPVAVKHRTITMGPYQVFQFLLPDPQGKVIGSVTVFKATEAICNTGPDSMFDVLSTTDIGLCRNPVSAGGSRLEGWTRHFAQNWGAKYKFGVNVQSKGFDEAPDAILQAVHRLKWAGKSAVPAAAQFITDMDCAGADIHEANVDFNECLSLGYMQNDRINYHDDGEKELGPTVATLSLGSPASMAFRPKKKSGMSGVVSQATAPTAAGREYSDVLSFPLYHGDLLVMHGTLIHRYYEHKVEPAGNRRFALTCRYIDPATMKSNEARQQALIKGTMPPGSEKFAYNGDMHLGEASVPALTTVANETSVDNTSGNTSLNLDTPFNDTTLIGDTAVNEKTVEAIITQTAEAITNETPMATNETAEATTNETAEATTNETVEATTNETVEATTNETVEATTHETPVSETTIEDKAIESNAGKGTAQHMEEKFPRYNFRARKTLSYKIEL